MKGMILLQYRPLLSEAGWRQLLQALGFALLRGLVQGAALVALLPAVTALATGGPVWGLEFGPWLAILAVLAAAGAAVEYTVSMVGYQVALDYVQSIQRKIGDKIALLPLGYLEGGGSDASTESDTSLGAGGLSRLVSNEMMQTGEGLAHMAYPLMSNLACGAVLIGGSFAWDWHLGLALALAVPAFYLLLCLARLLLGWGKRLEEPAEVEMADRIVEFARCQGALRSGGLGLQFPQLQAALAGGFRATNIGLALAGAGNLIMGIASQSIVVVLILSAATLMQRGTLGGLETISFIGMSLRFITVLDDINKQMFGLEERRQMLGKMRSILSQPILPEPSASAPCPDPSLAGQIELRDVHFGYRPGQEVLRGISFTVPPRTMTALVGPSGCGKTTIARLIARFWDVQSGQVLVSGVDVRDLTTADLMRQLSLVFQDVYLFDDTLEENVRLGHPTASASQVRQAGELAGVSEIAQRRSGGWTSHCGEGGRALSGGERQRISVARALLKDAPIVLFDEATSALDAENEQHLVQTMDKLRQETTLLVIAHKLETIQNADQVIVLDESGQIAQVGKHQDLVASPGPYRQFWEKRHAAATWRLATSPAQPQASQADPVPSPLDNPTEMQL